jgi:branched-chain amino acid transport system substrate-binding protein
MRFISENLMILFASVLLCAVPASAQDNPIRIGVLTDMSGVYSDASGQGSVEAVKMAIEDFKDPIFGKPVEMVSADHQNNAATAASIARKWYDNDGVDIVVDLTNSAVAIAVQDISQEKRKIDLITGATMTTAVTNKNCSPWGLHWTIDAYNQAAGTASYLTEAGGKSWYFITVDFAFGHDTEAKASAVVKADGGTVLGHSLHPLNGTDFSSYLLQAKASGADVIGLATAGTDMSNLVKQASEFHMIGKQKIAALVTFLSAIHSLEPSGAQGITLTTPFYWDQSDEARAWSQRFFKRTGAMPDMAHAGVYSAVMHYLKAVKAVASRDADAVMTKMRETPVNDFFAQDGRIRADGVLERDMYLAVVKTPEESKGEWDLYSIVKKLPREQLFQPLSESTCPLVKK